MLMPMETMELGPIVNSNVPTFSLLDHREKARSLDELMGMKGIMLGFIGDIWKPASVRRILWLQRHVQKFALMGAPVALVIQDFPYILDGFQASSPLPVPFPLLSDPDGSIHKAYRMDRHPGLLLVDRNHLLREKWLMPDDRVWPKIHELADSIQSL